jgi:hypothetical protein
MDHEVPLRTTALRSLLVALQSRRTVWLSARRSGPERAEKPLSRLANLERDLTREAQKWRRQEGRCGTSPYGFLYILKDFFFVLRWGRRDWLGRRYPPSDQTLTPSGALGVAANGA